MSIAQSSSRCIATVCACGHTANFHRGFSLAHSRAVRNFTKRSRCGLNSSLVYQMRPALSQQKHLGQAEQSCSVVHFFRMADVMLL